MRVLVIGLFDNDDDMHLLQEASKIGDEVCALVVSDNSAFVMTAQQPGMSQDDRMKRVFDAGGLPMLEDNMTLRQQLVSAMNVNMILAYEDQKDMLSWLPVSSHFIPRPT